MPQVDDLLFQAALAGQPQAINELLHQVQPDVVRYARLQCLVSDLDDAMQDALLMLSRRANGVRAMAAFAGRLWRSVRLAYRRLRPQLPSGYDTSDAAVLEGWLAQRECGQLQLEMVHMLESLPVSYRQIILLRDIEELGMAEIASVLDITKASAKNRLHRARAMAREYLLAEG
ncbi:sigma-70 family RNA polymerase sigma factor [Pokkaliibacter sp. MBI-7]|uniref:RNA polymerase sigma factor n=1 Tax=Pokkaliibacter sp. MBI-7 TaxID=3040600 RepID=UPI00244B3A49|nr:sigma-70 family RNA polymerase sigma factor [Pokkaliibacter sp. MBI-7]MDH2431997.1 sigma-70 family RNA polymerase sigma factor [Pokkaliibacter sp. MBI-7]